MFENSRNTVNQGSIGLTAAIFYYQKNGFNVSVPLVDNQGYDLVVESNSQFHSVQVKTSNYKPNGNYVVQMRKIRPNKTANVIHPMDVCDLVFVLCGNGDCYSIPYTSITTNNIFTVTNFDRYKADLGF